MSWSHRPALDGLRTVAVYLVVLYHCGVAAFTGGFVGVDLFFVLSGFLVTSVLIDQLHATGTIRLRRFYARRVRRLLPAALIVIVATSAVMLLVASSPARVPWVDDARGALLYVANWRFLFSEADYFAADINTSPFLHFWSLAIEEQFYLVLPVLLLGVFKLRRRWAPAVTTVLTVLLVLGIGAQVFWAIKDPTWAYYGTDARIYQLLLGSLAAWLWYSSVAIHLGANVGRENAPLSLADRLRALSAWTAVVALLLVASGWFDVNASIRGFAAAAASVVLIWAVTDEWSLSLNWIFSRTTISYLGRISYGTYLWHWPLVLVFRDLFDVLPWVLTALVGVTATALAALSARLIEMPIRRPSFLDRAPGPTIAAGLTFSIMCAVGFSPWLLQADVRPAVAATGASVTVGQDAQKVPQGIDWATYVKDNGSFVSTCIDGERASCWVHRAKNAKAPKVMLVGDSHAQQIAATFKKLATEHDFTLATSIMQRCSWQLGVRSTEPDADPNCPELREHLYAQQIAAWGIDVVVLAQRNRDENPTWHGLITAPGVTGDVDDVNRVTVDRTLQRLSELGVKVVVVGSQLQSQTAGIDDPLGCLATATYADQCAVPAPITEPFSDSLYRVYTSTHANQQVVSFNRAMCPAWPVCSPILGKVPLFHDANHMTSTAIVSRQAEIWTLLARTGWFATPAS